MRKIIKVPASKVVRVGTIEAAPKRLRSARSVEDARRINRTFGRAASDFMQREAARARSQQG